MVLDWRAVLARPKVVEVVGVLVDVSQYGFHCRRHAAPCVFLTWWSAEAWRVL